VLGALRHFASEAVVVARERRSGLSVSAYFASKILVRVPIDVILLPLLMTLCSLATTHWSAPWTDIFLAFLIIYAQCAALGFLISLLFSPTSAGLLSVAAGLVLPLFGGFFPPLGGARGVSRAIMSLSFARYTNPIAACGEFREWAPVWEPQWRGYLEDYIGFDCEGTPGSMVWQPVLLTTAVGVVVFLVLALR
jgi:hypothetical protein